MKITEILVEDRYEDDQLRMQGDLVDRSFEEELHDDHGWEYWSDDIANELGIPPENKASIWAIKKTIQSLSHDQKQKIIMSVEDEDGVHWDQDDDGRATVSISQYHIALAAHRLGYL